MKKTVFVKDIPIGGNNPISIQSMTNTKTTDIQSTIEQTLELYNLGADLVRISFPTLECIETLKELKKYDIPIIGDIHYNHKIAIAAVENGIDKIRINPSNISKNDILNVVRCCKTNNVPIRVGVNKGSIRNNDFSAKNIAELALENVKIIEDCGYDQIVVAAKSSDVKTTIDTYRYLDKICDYPLHIGLTESGTKEMGSLKSTIVLGSLLCDGIGDTLRISLATNPVEEVLLAKKLLNASGADKNFVDIVACPTCGRTNIDVFGIAKKLQDKTHNIKKPLKIAVMGCVVNGIGESQGAKFGVAGGKDKSSIFLDGNIIKIVDNDDILKELMKLTEEILNE